MVGKILLIDPDPAIRAFLCNALSRADFEVVAESTGFGGIARMDPSIDVVLSAIRMPEADGMAVLAAASERMLDPVVVVSTAPGDLELAASALRAGAFDFIVKPTAPGLLNAALQRAVQHRGLLEERRVHRLTEPAFRHLESDRAAATVTEAALEILSADAVLLLRGRPPKHDVWQQSSRSGLASAVVERLVQLSADLWADGAVTFPNELAADLCAMVQPLNGSSEIHGLLWAIRSGDGPRFGASDERRARLLANQVSLLGAGRRVIEAQEQKLVLLQSTRSQLVTRERTEAIGRMAFSAARHLQDPVAYTRTHLRSALTAAERAPPSDDPDDTALSSHLRYAMEGLERVERIGRDLGQLARSRDDMPLDLRALAEQAVRMADGLKQPPVLDVPEAQIRGNTGDLVQAILAIVENADRATGDGGPPVTLTGEIVGEMAVLTVSDQGSGMSRSQLESMFTTYDSGWGRAGLGCCAAKEIVDRHGGKISAKSRRGRGTQVTLAFPAEAVEEMIVCGE